MSWSCQVLGCDGCGRAAGVRVSECAGAGRPIQWPAPAGGQVLSSAERLDLAHELRPRLVDGLLSLLDAGERLLRRVVDLEVVRSLERRGRVDRVGAVDEDLTDGGVVEVLVDGTREGRVVVGRDLTREGAGVLERLDLLFGSGQPGGELLRLLGVLALG